MCTVCVCVRVTSFIICFSMQWQWQWQWQYRCYCKRFGVFIFIPLDWMNTGWVRKPKNFVKSSHSSIIIRVLSLTSLSLSLCLCLCVSTSLSKVTKLKYFCRMYTVRVYIVHIRNTYAVLPFIVLRLFLLVWRESLPFFSQKNHANYQLFYRI